MKPDHATPLNFSFTVYKIVLAIVLVVNLLPLSSRFILFFFFPLLCENVSGPLNIFLLPACTVLSFVDRECWRDMAGDFCFLVLVCLLCGLQQHTHLLQRQPTELPSACVSWARAAFPALGPLKCGESPGSCSRQPGARTFSFYLSFVLLVADYLGGTLSGQQLFFIAS